MDSVDVTTFPDADDTPTARLSVSAGDDPGAQPVPAASPPVAAAREERCVECGAPMAPDQRYCVECGERRGERRFPAVLAAGDRTPAQASPPHRNRPRMSPSSTLIAGVGTLLLAMGVGVLIGRSGTSSSAHGTGSGVQVVTVGGSGSATSAPTTTTGPTSTTPGSAKSSSSKSAGASKSTAAKTKASKLPPPTVKIGSKGTGKGYKNGHFTGEFFGSEEE
jgi:hypothetical protein